MTENVRSPIIDLDGHGDWNKPSLPELIGLARLLEGSIVLMTRLTKNCRFMSFLSQVITLVVRVLPTLMVQLTSLVKTLT